MNIFSEQGLFIFALIEFAVISFFFYRITKLRKALAEAEDATASQESSAGRVSQSPPLTRHQKDQQYEILHLRKENKILEKKVVSHALYNNALLNLINERCDGIHQNSEGELVIDHVLTPPEKLIESYNRVEWEKSVENGQKYPDYSYFQNPPFE